jgi:hypothetical protein
MAPQTASQLGTRALYTPIPMQMGTAPGARNTTEKSIGSVIQSFAKTYAFE